MLRTLSWLEQLCPWYFWHLPTLLDCAGSGNGMGGCLCSSFRSSRSRIDLSDVKSMDNAISLWRRSVWGEWIFCLLYWRVFSKSDVTLNVFLYYWSFFTRERNTNSSQRNWQLLQVMSYKEKHLRGCQTLKSTKRQGDKKITLVVIREIFVYCKQWIPNVKPPNLVIFTTIKACA